MNEYIEQAKAFLEKTKTSFKAVFLHYGSYFHDDTDFRDVYQITLENLNGTYVFKFGQSLVNSRNYKPSIKRGMSIFEYEETKIKAKKNIRPPSEYDILASITKYDPGSLNQFCSECGYDSKNIDHMKIYSNVVEEYQNVMMLFREHIKELSEIQ